MTNYDDAEGMLRQMVILPIVAGAHPMQIYLFGSRAREDHGPDSDYDLLVVMSEVRDKRSDAAHIRSLVQGFPYGVDILVTTPADLAWKGAYPGTIEHAALQEGRLIYGPRAA